MVKWSRWMAHDQEVMGSNPDSVYCMDVSDDASYYIHENNKNKGSRMGQTKKNQKKTLYLAKCLFHVSLNYIKEN